MAGAVVEVQPTLPQGAAGHHVQPVAAAALPELHRAQRQMAAQNQREHLPLPIRHRAKGNGTGHVGGGRQILAAAVHQEQALRLQRNVRLRGGGIVHNGSVGTIGGNGLKAGAKVARLFFAQLFQLFGGRTLGDRLLAHPVLQPVQKAAQGRAVLHVCPALLLQLGGVLAGFVQAHRAFLVQKQHIGGHTVPQSVAGLGRVHPQGRALGQGLYVIINFFIGGQLHPIGGQPLLQRLVKGRGLGKQQHPLRLHRRKGQHHRVAGHVIAPQVQQPGNVVQGGQHQAVGLLLGHFGPNLGQLVGAAAPGVGLVQLPGLPAGAGGPIRPDVPHQIQFPVQDDPVQRLAETLHLRRGQHPAVIAQHAAAAQVGLQPLGQRGHARLAHAVQGDSDALQLARRLNKIAAVCPQTGLHPLRGAGHRRGARAAGKTGQPGAAIVVVSCIF